MYDVEIEQLSLMALFDLKGSQSALLEWCGHALPDFPSHPLGFSVRDGRDLMWLGKEHWILRAPLDDEAQILADLRPDQAPDDISVVMISDTLTFFSVTGPDADDVMAVASSLDLRAKAFAENGATFSEAFSTKALILRADGGYHLGVDRSYAAMIADYFARATAD